MTWLIDSDKAAECTTTNCVQYPPYKLQNIEFFHDTSNGVFNMTINPVTFKADGRVIKCKDGSDTVHVTLAVKVFPEQSTTIISEPKDDRQDMINITAISGCVFPSSAITLQWYYYEAGQKPRLHQMGSPTVRFLTVCTSGTCGGNDVVQMSSTLSIPEVQTGKEYYFQIAINHEDDDSTKIVLVNSTQSYKIKQIHSEIIPEAELPVTHTLAGTVAVLIVIIVILVVAAVVVAIIIKRKRPSTTTKTYHVVNECENAGENKEGCAEITLKETEQTPENEPAEELDKIQEEEIN
ncbi:uncharacterized protein LOC123528262 isoform X2 [Mercenaria mercenaria]|nr:uncharacterized protein LOC123528262 isoform X2 [Mercenaria mercenaria]